VEVVEVEVVEVGGVDINTVILQIRLLYTNF